MLKSKALLGFLMFCSMLPLPQNLEYTFGMPIALAREESKAVILSGEIDVGRRVLIVNIAAGRTAEDRDVPEQQFRIDASHCQSSTLPVVQCTVKIVDTYARYRFGAQVSMKLEISLVAEGLYLPAYSRTELVIGSEGSSNVNVVMPQIKFPGAVQPQRLKMINRTSLGNQFMGYSSLSGHPLLSGILYGLVNSFQSGSSRNFGIAFDLNSSKILWASDIETGNSPRFLSTSPLDQSMVIGGRFQRDGAAMSNLVLVDARTGTTIRNLLGVEEFDVTASYWANSRLLVSHASVTERVVGRGSIVDKQILRGVIVWHDLETGRLLRTIESPLLEAEAIEQSTDERFVAFVGYDGAAVIDVITGETVFFMHFSDLYGPEYRDCHNFGCGPNHAGFQGIDLTVDKRIAVMSTIGGPIHVIDTQSKLILYKIDLKILQDGGSLFLRTLKIDRKQQLLYVYATEKSHAPSTGHVLVYKLATGKLRAWYQAPHVLGMSGGNAGGNVFSPDFKQLFSSDSADGIADSRMLRNGMFRVYEME